MNPSIDDLIDQYLTVSSVLNVEQIHTLSQWLAADPANQRQYIRATIFHRALHDHLVQQDPSRQLFMQNSAGYDTGMFQAELEQLLNMEKESPAAPLPEPPSEIKAIKKSSPPTKETKVTKLWLTLAISTAALWLILLGIGFIISHNPKPVATLLDTHEARWQTEREGLSLGTRLKDKQKEPITLTQGLAKIQFDNGSVLTLEGPLQFLIQSESKVTLNYGKLCARASHDPDNFQVNTKYYQIVDLGTEFGIQVSRDGQTQVQMYDGKAALIKYGTPKDKAHQIITRNQARHVDNNGTITKTQMDPRAIVRQFSTSTGIIWRGEPIDLADIVGGGNGLGTGQENWGIEFATGQFKLAKPQEGTVSEQTYIPVKDSPFIDGVFTPGKAGGVINISSEGHQFSHCPQNMGGYTGFITSGTYGVEHTLKGVSANKAGGSTIFLHSNQGITFDLKALRQLMRSLHPEIQISNFHAQVGISDQVIPVRRDLHINTLPKADFFVLVDGHEQFQNIGFDPETPLIDVNVELAANTRFLSLLVTDSDQNNSHDWVIITNPFLDVTY